MAAIMPVVGSAHTPTGDSRMAGTLSTVAGPATEPSAAGGFAIAILLLWAGAFGDGGLEKLPGTLVTALALGAISIAAFVTAASRRRE